MNDFKDLRFSKHAANNDNKCGGLKPVLSTDDRSTLIGTYTFYTDPEIRDQIHQWESYIRQWEDKRLFEDQADGENLFSSQPHICEMNYRERIEVLQDILRGRSEERAKIFPRHLHDSLDPS